MTNDSTHSIDRAGQLADRVDAVLFDLDGTLVDYDQAGDELLPAAFERAGIEPFCTYAELEAVAAEVPNEPDRSHVDYWTEIFERAARRHDGDPDHARALYDAYGDVFDRTQVHFLPGAEAALHAARDSCRVGLVTNGHRAIQEAKLENLGLADAFETAVYADGAAARTGGEREHVVDDPKPASEPFRVALDDLGVDPGDALYVGNSLRSDVAGAAPVGLRTAWCPLDETGEDATAVDREPDYTLDTLHDLAALLRESTSPPPGRNREAERGER